MKAVLSNDEDADMQQTDPDLEVIRTVGVGYNLIRGAPEGVFDLGGDDPGIESTRYILRFTYDEGKTKLFRDTTYRVPDQVNYQLAIACSSSTIGQAYSGTESYQKNLETSASAEGKLAHSGGL